MTPPTLASVVPVGLTPALVRTLVPVLIGPIVVRYGIDAADEGVILLTGALVSMAYYLVVRLLENYKSQFGLLLGFAKPPVYDVPEPTVVVLAADEDTVVIVGHPVLTDNGPKDGDPVVQLEQGASFLGEMR